MINETWRDIKGYEGLYAISSTGRVKRLARNRIIATGVNKPLKEKMIKTFKGKHGYIHVNLWKNGQMKQHRIHRLIMLAHTEKPQNKNVINHIDGDKTNNILENLEWCTSKENTMHGFETGLMKKGERHSQAKLKDVQILDIKRIYSEGESSQRYLARKFNVTQATIWRIVNNKSRYDSEVNV